MIFQLIFTCAIAKSVSKQELAEFAETASVVKSKFGITGILLCQDGSVMQVLEGEQPVVEALFTQIEKDARLTEPLVLIRRHAPAREFEQWSMGYPNAEETDVVFNLCRKTQSKFLSDNLSAEIRIIGQTFARVNGLLAA